MCFTRVVFTVKPKLPEDFESQTWSKLQAAVRAVHTKQHVATSLEELYRVRPAGSSRNSSVHGWHAAAA